MTGRSLVPLALVLVWLAPAPSQARAVRLVEGTLSHPWAAGADLVPGAGSDGGAGMFGARIAMTFIAEAAVAVGVGALSMVMLAAALEACGDNLICAFDRAFAWVMLLLVGEAFFPPLAGAAVATLLETSAGGRPSFGWTYLVTQAVWLVGALVAGAVSDSEVAAWAVLGLSGAASSVAAVVMSHRSRAGSGAGQSSARLPDPRPPVRPIEALVRREARGATVLAVAW